MRRLEGATRQRGKRSGQARKSIASDERRHYEDSDKRRERNQQRRLNRDAVPIDLLQGLRVDLWGEDQNRNERDPNKHKEADHKLLGAIEDLEKLNQNVRPARSLTARSAGHRTQHLSTDEPRSSSNHQPVRKEGQSRPAIRRLDTSLGRQACPFLRLFELERYDREDKTRQVEGAEAGKVTNVSDLALNEPPGLHRGTHDKHIWRIVQQFTKAAGDELINDRLARCTPQPVAPT